jgi:hypothetical protein
LIDPNYLSTLREECEIVFSARDVEEGEAYSSGVTFFLPAGATPRCALEDLVLQIFRAHTHDLIPGHHYDIERSGAEWWTLVLETNSSMNGKTKDKVNEDMEEDDDDDDEIGMHFDADYGLEEQLPNYMIHPRIATVTYLSDVGVPTLILDKKSPPPSDIQKLSLGGDITRGWLSYPSTGKHTAFDGRFLHGAPSSFFPADTHESEDESKPKRRKVNLDDDTSGSQPINSATNKDKRITLLVNIWINHCPLDAEIMDEELSSQLSPVWTSQDTPSPIGWALPSVTKSDHVPVTHVDVATDVSDKAGIETTVLCNHNIVLHFHSSQKDLDSAVQKVKEVQSKSLEIVFGPGALELEVGDVLESDSD